MKAFFLPQIFLFSLQELRFTAAVFVCSCVRVLCILCFVFCIPCVCACFILQGDRLVASPPTYTADLSALPAALDGAKRLTEVLQVTLT